MRMLYVKPEVTMVEIDTCFILSTSCPINDTKGDFETDFVRGHRGVWGDLWTNSSEEKDTK